MSVNPSTSTYTNIPSPYTAPGTILIPDDSAINNAYTYTDVPTPSIDIPLTCPELTGTNGASGGGGGGGGGFTQAG